MDFGFENIYKYKGLFHEHWQARPGQLGGGGDGQDCGASDRSELPQRNELLQWEVSYKVSLQNNEVALSDLT